MIIDAVATGKTVDDAVLAACIKLGKAREDVEIEILELPKRGFLGLTHIPAKVRAFIEVEDASKTAERKAAEAAAAAPAPAPRQQLASMRQNPAAKDTRTPSKPAPSPAATPAPSTAPHFSKPQGQAHGKIEPASPLPTATEPLKHRESEPEDNGAMIELTKNGTCALEYVKGIIKLMGAENVEIVATQFEKAVVVKISGEGAGAVIGRRGETLDALQYLTGLAANRSEEDYCRVVIDAGNYRQKRKQTLELLAKRLANNAIKTGRPTTLEPMNPYERRIIHATVSEIKGAVSTSVGEEPNRSVVISSENSQYKPRTNAPRGRKPFVQGDKRPFNNDRRPRPAAPAAPIAPTARCTAAPAAPIAAAPAAPIAPVEKPAFSPAPKKAEPAPVNPSAVRSMSEVSIPDAPLYGKIEI